MVIAQAYCQEAHGRKEPCYLCKSVPDFNKNFFVVIQPLSGLKTFLHNSPALHAGLLLLNPFGIFLRCTA